MTANGLTPKVYELLKRQGTASAHDLAESLSCSRQAAYQALTRLCRSGHARMVGERHTKSRVSYVFQATRTDAPLRERGINQHNQPSYFNTRDLAAYFFR